MSCTTAFLAVALDDELRAVLHHVACAIEASPEQSLGVEGVGFLPHAEDKLHMTFVFCGEALKKLPKANVTALHGEIQAKTRRNSALEGHLEFKAFELFPPEKMNLIIARFEAPPFLRELRQFTWAICLKYGVAMKDDEDWMPHITLGKIKATKAQVGHVSCHSLVAPTLDGAALQPLGLTLLGSRPKQVWLDWDEALLFAAGGTASADGCACVDQAGSGIASNACSEVPDPDTCSGDALDLIWLSAALCDEVSVADAEGLHAAVAVILSEVKLGSECSSVDADESINAAREVLRDGGAPLCADRLYEHFKG